LRSIKLETPFTKSVLILLTTEPQRLLETIVSRCLRLSFGGSGAARLSEDPQHRVLLLEAGGEARSPWISVPVGYARLLGNPRYNWMYQTEPESMLGDRKLDVPCGRTIGGTGSINGMLYVRGHPADYDAWRDAGNEGCEACASCGGSPRARGQVHHGDLQDGPSGYPSPKRSGLLDALALARRSSLRATRCFRENLDPICALERIAAIQSDGLPKPGTECFMRTSLRAQPPAPCNGGADAFGARSTGPG